MSKRSISFLLKGRKKRQIIDWDIPYNGKFDFDWINQFDKDDWKWAYVTRVASFEQVKWMVENEVKCINWTYLYDKYKDDPVWLLLFIEYSYTIPLIVDSWEYYFMKAIVNVTPLKEQYEIVIEEEKYRTNKRCKIFKDDLIDMVYHPKFVKKCIKNVEW